MSRVAFTILPILSSHKQLKCYFQACCVAQPQHWKWAQHLPNAEGHTFGKPSPSCLSCIRVLHISHTHRIALYRGIPLPPLGSFLCAEDDNWGKERRNHQPSEGTGALWDPKCLQNWFSEWNRDIWKWGVMIPLIVCGYLVKAWWKVVWICQKYVLPFSLVLIDCWESLMC